MQISLNFIKKYTDINLNLNELVNKMNNYGLPVDEIIEKKCEVSNVYVAQILDIQKHPNADKLSLCKVTDGKNTYSVVCGAKNIKVNDIVPLAIDGAHLPGNIVIKKTTIRGIESEGMLCSAKELGISDDSTGILILNSEKNKIGEPFIPFESDIILNIDITPNRSDLFCATGIARLLSSILNKKFYYPDFKIKKDFVDNKLDINKELKVKLIDKEKCLRYAVRLIKGVKIAESPSWLKETLLSCGIRPINNIVDITNYVLLELNQPLHAFDYNKLAEHTIIVRRAEKNEEILALNEKKYTLTDDDLVIADARQPIAIAGVMGGEHFSIDSSTTDIVLECAYFNPSSIRKTTRRHFISSDSSQRFEKGIDINNVINAMNRAVKLIVEIAGGKVSKNYIDIYPLKYKTKKIKVRFERINKILGTNLKNKKILKLIKQLHLKPVGITSNSFSIVVPSYRIDLKEEIDIIEDIAQIYGYDKIPLTLPVSEISIGEEIPIESFNKSIRTIMTTFGFSEVKNYSFLNDNLNNHLLKNEKLNIENAVKLQNPFNEEESYLKTTLIPDLLKNYIYNYNNGNHNIHLFEIASTYSINNGNFKQTPFLGAISGGFIIEPSFNHNKFVSDFYFLKSIINNILDFLKTNKLVEYKNISLNENFFDYHCNILLNNEIIGILGQIKKDIIYENKIKNNIFYFELNLEKLFKYYNKKIKYQKFSTFPYVKRDLSIIVKNDIPLSDVEKNIYESGQSLIKNIRLYDLYYGEQIPEGCKSFTFSIIFQASDRTLSESEINDIMNNIINNLKTKLSAELRT